MRLIDADALLDFLDVGHLRPPTEICFSELMMKNIIELMPTVDAVPVVRCKDCIRYREYTYLGTQKVYVCERDYRKRIYDMKEDDYCSRGERKEE